MGSPPETTDLSGKGRDRRYDERDRISQCHDTRGSAVNAANRVALCSAQGCHTRLARKKVDAGCGDR